MKMMRVAALIAVSLTTGTLKAEVETAMWGFTPGRNMVVAETGLPQQWDLKTGQNIKWTAQLGSQTYAGPLIIGGKVFVGTNNEAKRIAKDTGDRGVMMAFSESDGSFLWQASHTKLPAGRVNDWPQQGICSTPYIDGDRLYYVSNRCEVVSVDTEGFLDGVNDGAIQDEADTTKMDADLIWKLDMIGELNVFPHNLATCSPICVGDLLFVITSNGVDAFGALSTRIQGGRTTRLTMYAKSRIH